MLIYLYTLYRRMLTRLDSNFNGKKKSWPRYQFSMMKKITLFNILHGVNMLCHTNYLGYPITKMQTCSRFLSVLAGRCLQFDVCFLCLMWVNLRNNSWKPQNVSNFNMGNIIFFKRKYPER